MTDFELGIINAVRVEIKTEVKACFFYLRQNIYQKIQAEGLQEEYNDPDDRSIKIACQKMCALAFLPIDQVVNTFDELCNEIPENFIPI